MEQAIGVPAKKCWGCNTVLPKFYDFTQITTFSTIQYKNEKKTSRKNQKKVFTWNLSQIS